MRMAPFHWWRYGLACAGRSECALVAVCMRSEESPQSRTEGSRNGSCVCAKMRVYHVRPRERALAAALRARTEGAFNVAVCARKRAHSREREEHAMVTA